MAYAFAKRERAQRNLEDAIDLITGGTRPAAHVHEEVVDTMAAVGIDIADQTPQAITIDETQASDYVITLGCSANDVCPAGWVGNNREWDLIDPEGKAPETVAAIRDDIRERVQGLFNEIEAKLSVENN